MPISKVTSDMDLSWTGVMRRYMDLPKLLDLLHTRSLYFRRADGFADRLEGALFPILRESLDDAAKNGKSDIDAAQFYRRAREGNYVSCWSIGARDNMALWQLYGGVNTSMAITTTVQRLAKCGVAWDRKLHLRKVRYVDHRRVGTFAIGEFDDVLQYKSDAYKFERELRMILPQQDDWENNPMGIRLPLSNLDDLIRSIVVSPDAEPSFIEAVKELCKRYGVTAPVRMSALATMPL
jgi:hypothetical protein